jgi:hypothetical protein
MSLVLSSSPLADFGAQRLSQNLPNAQSAIESGSSAMKEVRNNQRTAEEYLSSTLQVDADILMSYTRNVLVALCSERHLNIVGQKKVLVQRLIKWVCLTSTPVKAPNIVTNFSKPNTTVVIMELLPEIPVTMLPVYSTQDRRAIRMTVKLTVSSWVNHSSLRYRKTCYTQNCRHGLAKLPRAWAQRGREN